MSSTRSIFSIAAKLKNIPCSYTQVKLFLFRYFTHLIDGTLFLGHVLFSEIVSYLHSVNQTTAYGNFRINTPKFCAVIICSKPSSHRHFTYSKDWFIKRSNMNDVNFKVCKSMHHHTTPINQLDATISQVYYLTFMYSSTCFGHPHAHPQELDNCGSSLWFSRWSVVLLVVVGPAGRPTAPRSSSKTRGCYRNCRAPEDAQNMLSCT
jgi:hypothetical protein